MGSYLSLRHLVTLSVSYSFVVVWVFSMFKGGGKLIIGSKLEPRSVVRGGMKWFLIYI